MTTVIIVWFCFFFSAFLPEFQAGRDNPDSNPSNIIWVNYRNTCPAVAMSNYNPQGDFETLTIPVKRAGNLILIDAIVDSLAGNLIFDTGATKLVLNSTYFRKSRFAGNQLAGGVTGTVQAVSRSRVKNLQISEMFYENIEADITDLGHIENARNVKILGFFGLSMLSGFEVVLDLKNSCIELHRLNRSGERITKLSKPVPFDLTLPIRLNSDVMFINASISGKSLTFCLDTGAEVNLLGSHLSNKILGTVSIVRRSTLRGAGSNSVEVLYGIMNDFSIAGINLPGMHVMITNLFTMGNAFQTPVDGMLGCGFLEQGSFTINLKKKEIGINFYNDIKK